MRKLLFTLIAFLSMSLSAFADIAPAEQISYTFHFDGIAPVKIAANQSEQLQCQDNQCLDPKPLGKFGIQALNCDEISCYAVSYDFSPYQKLIVKFEDGTLRESEVFPKPAGRKNAMRVTVTPDALKVEREEVPLAPDHLTKGYIISAMIFVFLAEALAAAVFVYMNKLPAGVFLAFLVLNLITIPLNWLMFANYVQSDGILWTAAFLVEFVLLCLFFAKRRLCKEIFGLTLFANVAGYSSGMILSFLITFF